MLMVSNAFTSAFRQLDPSGEKAGSVLNLEQTAGGGGRSVELVYTPSHNEAEIPRTCADGSGVMADDSRANAPSQGPNDGSRGVKPATSWVLPLVTAAVLASAFCLYYFVYVVAQREYLANRNFRFLAVLGDQIQAMVSIHGSILEFR